MFALIFLSYSILNIVKPNFYENMPHSISINRITTEYKQLQKDPEEYFVARPLEDNLFEWHFVFKGPPDTDYTAGLYHGKLILPTEYPMKPPSIIMLTPSGRFVVGQRICLNISDFHPESWTSNMGIRGIIISLISFMCEETVTTGGIRSPSFVRKSYAKKSWSYNLSDKKFCEIFPDYVDECKEKSELYKTEKESLKDRITIFMINYQNIIVIILISIFGIFPSILKFLFK